MHPGTEFYFITGLDSFLEIRTWNQWEASSSCSFVVLSRPGYRFADLGKIDFMENTAKELAKLDSGKLVHAVFQPDGFNICMEMIPLTTYHQLTSEQNPRIQDH
jgi:nicotinic acid mononucleotide adenylyltransferase